MYVKRKLRESLVKVKPYMLMGAAGRHHHNHHHHAVSYQWGGYYAKNRVSNISQLIDKVLTDKIIRQSSSNNIRGICIWRRKPYQCKSQWAMWRRRMGISHPRNWALYYTAGRKSRRASILFVLPSVIFLFQSQDKHLRIARGLSLVYRTWLAHELYSCASRSSVKWSCADHQPGQTFRVTNQTGRRRLINCPLPRDCCNSVMSDFHLHLVQHSTAN